MCGIAGIMSRDGQAVPRSVLETLALALAHRGPDGQGFHVRDGVGLVHTRLAIVDVAGGAQPLLAGDAALVANGEIYNDPDLRRDLKAAFKTTSDCESPLHLFLRDGVTFAAKLRGMYAIAVHDAARNRLVLARDPFGIKPLYYAETAVGFCFASEPQALIAAELAQPKINTAARDEVLGTQFSAGVETPYQGIFRVAPGETLVVEAGRIVARHRHAAVTPPAHIFDHAAPEDLDAVWEDSVRAHQRADVPYGMFLSGGIDSAAILAVMARLNPRGVLAFTAAFPGTDVHDERDQARATAAAAGAHHVEIEVTAADFWRDLPAIAAVLDDPVADYAVVPTYLLARRAARDVKVVLTGEGGDELFAGYGRYRAAARWLFPKRPWRRPLLQGFDGLRAPVSHWRRAIDAAESASAGFSKLAGAQAVDCATWLPGDLLTKVDRCLMAHGVEGRVPFVDPKVAEFAFALPDRLKLRGRQGKWILRQWLARHFPAANPFLPKRGFTVPVAAWIAAEGRRLAPLMARNEGVAEICRPEAVERLYTHPTSASGHVAWVLLFYALWHRRHMLGLAPAGDVFATLASR